MDMLRRLWQPRHPLFWMMVMFNALSSVCTWAMRALPLNTFALLLIGAIALMNVACGLWVAWRLMQIAAPTEAPATPAHRKPS